MDTIRDKEILEKIVKKSEKKSKSILVVGGTGFIGYNLIKSCLKKI